MKKDKSITEASTEEELILHAVAKSGNYSEVAREFDTYHVRVSRLWNKLTEEEKEHYRNAVRETKEKVHKKIVEEEVKTVTEYQKTIAQSLGIASSELLDRLESEPFKFDNYSLISALRLLNSIATDTKEDESENSDNLDIFHYLDNSIKKRTEPNNTNNYLDNEKKTEE